MKKAFTLIELTVAVALLGLVLFFASVIFSVSIKGYRLASANAEIMQKLRAVTGQLSADFSGLQTDAPLLIWFQQDTNDPNQRYDQIMFFADGDFQSTQLYNDITKEPDPAGGTRMVIGNLARIYYGQAQIPDPNGGVTPCVDEGIAPIDQPERERLLARRQHILTADPCLAPWPDANIAGTFADETSGRYKNEVYEHDRVSLAQWKTVDISSYDPVLCSGGIIDVCFNFRPWIDMEDANTFHKLMCEGVGSFSIQWAYWHNNELRWFPSDDPNGDGTEPSHFTASDGFGVYLNIPNASQMGDWYTIGDAESRTGETLSPIKAFKFTFTLYDSKGIIPDGRRFTHIVYLED
jgi:prepilin-type N-terminal cleavage/methylation domain-containing protein